MDIFIKLYTGSNKLYTKINIYKNNSSSECSILGCNKFVDGGSYVKIDKYTPCIIPTCQEHKHIGTINSIKPFTIFLWIKLLSNSTPGDLYNEDSSYLFFGCCNVTSYEDRDHRKIKN